jgi:hypothetical protein
MFQQELAQGESVFRLRVDGSIDLTHATPKIKKFACA